MENLIASLLQDYEKGKVNRRQLIQSLSIAASAAAVVGPTSVKAAGSLSVSGINHISYRVANSNKTRDFYAGVLGMKVSNDTGTKCRLHVGGLEFHVQPGEDEVTRRTPLIDHIAYNVDNSKAEILAVLKSHGVNEEHGLNHPPSSGRKETGSSVQVKDPDGFHVTLSPRK